MKNEIAQEIHKEIAQVVSQSGLYLEEARLFGSAKNPTLRITIDLESGPGAVSSQALSEISKKISKLLDGLDPVENQYILEVSTPGVGRKLVERRHWSRALGRMVKVKTAEEMHRGRLTECDEAGILLESGEQRITVGWALILEGRVEVEFATPDI